MVHALKEMVKRTKAFIYMPHEKNGHKPHAKGGGYDQQRKQRTNTTLG
jgi:hypothetical protein